MSGRRVVVERVLWLALWAPLFTIGVRLFVPYDLKASPAEWIACSAVIGGFTGAVAERIVQRWWSGVRQGAGPR